MDDGTLCADAVYGGGAAAAAGSFARRRAPFFPPFRRGYLEGTGIGRTV